MATYRYQAVDPLGAHYPVTIEAESREHAVELVRMAEGDTRSLELVADSSSLAHRTYEPAVQLPPAAPRPVPRGVTGMAGGVVLALVGAIFVAIAAPMSIAGFAGVASGSMGSWFLALFPLIHLTVGLALLGVAWKSRQNRRRLYRDGEPVLATIDWVGLNRKVRINGSHPYKVRWSYEVGGRTHEGSRSTRNDEITALGPGDRLWVLHDPLEPSKSAEWPPM